ncbi:LysR substrate-binding domain-containing protein [Pandoraea apista]|uniref:LysR substrate-binding domain-containing protein n=1 Tax=Pandoraea apista TaxID=93218 RepID=UPI00058A9716|nr:LysR substrate-binding domain-containing protein [Pandoraea apista]AJF00022.1 LysR family transcriptional regulator [Pandoraea apista]AKH74173.1 LysR family transcriptional regulator [Pandoraea apista]AKI62722.1 LysR family transcriptional regulator [Pandoraea apista]
MSRRQLPPLHALRVFETAARAESLSAAAQELSITHGAVSRQIALLEDWLGQTLFVRQGQRNVATDHARAFAAEISAAFDRIDDAAVRFGKAPQTRIVRVNAQTTLAMHWLIARLPAFHAAYPDVQVVVTTSSSADPAFRGGFDVAIRRDPPPRPEWLPYEKAVLFTEQTSVVAAPALLNAIPLRRLKDLAKHAFVATQTRVGAWEDWLSAAGMPALRPLRFHRFDHYHVSLQAVVDGLGLGIGCTPTLDRELAAGRLTMPFPEIQVEGATYVTLVPRDADKSRPLRDFLAWVHGTASATSVALTPAAARSTSRATRQTRAGSGG